MLARLKDSFSEFANGSSVKTGATTLALATLLTFFSAASNTAQAEEDVTLAHVESGTAQDVSLQHVRVPMSDARHIELDGVKFSATHASDDALVLVVYGKNQDLFNRTHEAAKLVIAEGYPLRGIIVGPTDQPEQVDVYTDGQLYDSISKERDSSEMLLFYDRDVIRQALIDGYDDIVKPRLDAKAQPVAANYTYEQELADMSYAQQSSRDFAENNFGIGIVLRGGQDIPNEHFQTYEQLAEVFQQRYQNLLDQAYPNQNAQVRYFIAPNPDGKASLIAINIADRIYEIDNSKYGLPENLDPAILDLQTAWDAAPEVVEVLPTAKAMQAQREAAKNSAAAVTYSDR